MIIRPGVTVGDVKCGGTLYVFGKVKSGKLYGKQVKILRDPYPMYYEEPDEEQGGHGGLPPENPEYASEEYGTGEESRSRC